MKSISLAFILALILLLPVSCKKENNNTGLQPEITAVSPDSGVSGTAVTILGRDFPIPDSSKKINVSLNDSEAQILSVQQNEIHFLVPAGAGSGEVTLDIDNDKLTWPNFHYVPSYLIEGSDMGRKYQWVNLSFEDDAVNDASLTVNGTSLPKSSVYEGRYNGNLPAPLDPGSLINLSVTLADGTVFTGSGLVPEKPVITSPFDSTILSKPGSLTVEWTCPTNPDRFEVILDFNTQTSQYIGKTLVVSGMTRVYTYDLSDAPSGTLDLTIFSYSTGTFSGYPLSAFSSMNIRNESQVVHLEVE